MMSGRTTHRTLSPFQIGTDKQELAAHVHFYYEAIAYLRLRYLGHCFMEPLLNIFRDCCFAECSVLFLKDLPYHKRYTVKQLYSVCSVTEKYVKSFCSVWQ
jgi:hypothetical protein